MSRQWHQDIFFRPYLKDDEALALILASVGKRRSLVRNHLHEGGKHCAMGAFFEDHPRAAVTTKLANRIARLNDKDPRATPKQRWKRVMKWLREQVEKIEEAK